MDRPSAFVYRAGGEQTGWRVVLPLPAAAPPDITALLLDNPSFLNLHQPNAARIVALAPARSGGGQVAWFAVDEDGRVIIVALAHDRTRDAWTELVREVLALEGRAWRMAPGEFASLFRAAGGNSLAETAASKLPAAKAGDKFLRSVEANLGRGHFPVRLVGQEDDDECRQAVGYLAAMGLEAVGLVPRAFECSGVEVVVAQAVTVHVEARPVAVERPRPAATPIPQPASAPAQPQPKPAPAGGFQSSRPPTLSTAPRHATFGGASSQGDDKEGKTERNWPKLGGFEEATPKPVEPAAKPVTPPTSAEAQSAIRSPLSTRVPPPPSPEPEGKGPAPGTMPGTMSNKRPPKTGWGGLGKKK